MNGWTKFFVDGTRELGYDELVVKGLASWSKGRLDYMSAVELTHGNTTICIEGEGTFWQSDTFEARLLQNGGELVKRTLYRKIDPTDFFLIIKKVLDTHVIRVVRSEAEMFSNPINDENLVVGVHSAWRDKWIILEIDRGKVTWRIGDNGAISR